VDNDLEQAHRMQETLRQGKILNTIQIVSKTSQALEYLARSLELEKLPHCIMLDLTRGEQENRGFLQQLQATRNYASIPVIMLVSHEAEERLSYLQQHELHYIVRKPLDVKQLMSIVRACDNFFISLVTEKNRLHIEEKA
jgi:CheY-like chemotaxis protein